VGMSDDHEGTAGLAGLVSWLVITTLLSSGTVAVLVGGEADPAFGKIQNQFIGIISGIIGSSCYNKFKGTRLPDALAFFSGKRFVSIATAVVSIIAAAILFFIWPIVYGALVAVGGGIVGLGAVGAAIYTFLNRLLIPTGLHHALNSVFWFDAAGINDLGNFWAGEVLNGAGGHAGMYMSGFFPSMMFGIPAAALAIVHSAKPERRKEAAGLVGAAALCAFVCGVTEPFEFAFMFLAPALYLIYAILYGVITFITVSLGFSAGFSFSAGLTDLIFSSQLPAANNTFLILPLGLGAAIVFYFVFRFAIKAFDLKTPGREDDSEDETKIVLANDDFTTMAAIILEGLGGKENVTSVDNCITRLRLEIRDYTAVDEKKIKSAGISGVIRPSKTAVQVIIGPKVQFVADEFKKLM
jgi:PTS system N-acetylglucosamine-specific IIC component